MAEAGPYLESNQPYNPIPGLATGAIVGGGIMGLGAGAGIKGVNAAIDTRKKRTDQKISNLENSIGKAQNRMEEINFDSVSKPGMNWSTKDPRFQSRKKDYKALRQHTNDLQTELKYQKGKTHLNKIGGGKMAGIIGGTALAGALIGGTAGAIGNYD